MRLALALTFGLLHCLGFASGFDAAGPLRVPRLVAFNVGVELAQLSWLALAWPLLPRLGGSEGTRRVATVPALSVLAGAAATYARVGGRSRAERMWRHGRARVRLGTHSGCDRAARTLMAGRPNPVQRRSQALARVVRRLRRMAAASRSSLVLALLVLLSGCDARATNPDARIERDELLLYPGGCSRVRVIGVESFEDLRVRIDGVIVTHELIQTEGLLTRGTFLEVCGVELGMTEVRLLNGRSTVDSLFVEVMEIEGLALGAVQDEYPEEYPPVPRPVGLLVGRRALLYVVAVAPDGRSFDALFEDGFDILAEPPVELSYVLGGILFEPMSPVPGVFPLSVVGRDEVRTVELVVVETADIERIELAGILNADGGGGYSVTGVTGDGIHILGLDAELTINGVAHESTEGRWLFRGLAPGPGVSVVATWNGFEASLE